jgi:hypothetical protein
MPGRTACFATPVPCRSRRPIAIPGRRKRPPIRADAGAFRRHRGTPVAMAQTTARRARRDRSAPAVHAAERAEYRPGLRHPDATDPIGARRIRGNRLAEFELMRVAGLAKLCEWNRRDPAWMPSSTAGHPTTPSHRGKIVAVSICATFARRFHRTSAEPVTQTAISHSHWKGQAITRTFRENPPAAGACP